MPEIIMDNRSEPPSGRFPLVLYGAAIAVSLGAAAIASTAALAPHNLEQPVLVVSGSRVTGPDRIAAFIEPAAPVQAAAAQPAGIAPVTGKLAAPVQPEMVAAMPPKPQRRPCIECVATLAPVAAVQPTPPAADPAPAEAEYDVAAATPDGPVPPLPLGPVTGEGAGHGFLVRGGEAVVNGGTQIVGAAWTLSGAAVGGLVRGVRQLTF